MSGKMRLSYEDGRFFQGFYKEDEKNGLGVYSWPDGRMFFGNWTKGMINGEGIEVSADGMKVKGFWVDGQRVRVDSECSNEEFESFIENVLTDVKMEKFEVKFVDVRNNEDEDKTQNIQSESESESQEDSTIKSFFAFEMIEDDYDFSKSLRGDDYSVKGFSSFVKNQNKGELREENKNRKSFEKLFSSGKPEENNEFKREKGYYSSRGSIGSEYRTNGNLQDLVSNCSSSGQPILEFNKLDFSKLRKEKSVKKIDRDKTKTGFYSFRSKKGAQSEGNLFKKKSSFVENGD